MPRAKQQPRRRRRAQRPAARLGLRPAPASEGLLGKHQVPHCEPGHASFARGGGAHILSQTFPSSTRHTQERRPIRRVLAARRRRAR
eukprot:436327-Lingulodinium_polyedra.AAC.1